MRRFPEADLERYLQSVGLYRDMNDRVLRMTPAALAAFVADDLVRAGAVRREGGDLVTALGAAG